MDRTPITISSTGNQTPFNQQVLDNVMTVTLTGTYTTFAFTFQGSADNGASYANIACVDMASMQITAGGTTISPSNSTTRIFRVPSEGLTDVRLNVSTIASGSVTVNGQSGRFSGGVMSSMLIQNSTLTGNNTITGTQTITSNDAASLTVGPNGATNPVLQVNSATSSAATGVKVTGAAAAAGVAIAAISSGTNEALTLDAKGSGAITIGSLSTGDVILGTTAKTLTVANATGLVTIAAQGLTITAGNLLLSAGTITGTSTSAAALTVGANGATNPVLKINANTGSVATGIQVTGAAAAGGVALAAISSGTDETLKVDAKGAGTIALGDTSTSPVCLNRGSLKALQVGLTLTALGTVQSSTPTSAQLLGGVITQTGVTGAGTITLPTGTALSTACARTPATGDSFDCTFVNVGGGQTLTVTGAAGTTVVGGATIATAKSAKLTFICTGSNAWSIYTTGG